MNWFVSHAPIEYAGRFKGMVQRRKAELWTVNPNATPGDRVVMYVSAPVSSFVGMGTVTGRKWHDGRKHGWPGYRMINVRIDQAIEPPVHIRTIRKALPDWGWARMPQAQARVPGAVLPRFLRFLDGELRAVKPNEGKDALPSRLAGAGFGTPEGNRKVERAAIGLVRSRYMKQGWTIVDRQSDQCGYDLRADRGTAELHLEVKGTRDSGAGFIITRNELDCARSDPSFRLCVVTNALSDARRLSEYTAKEMEEVFDLTPIAYIGRRKQ